MDKLYLYDLNPKRYLNLMTLPMASRPFVIISDAINKARLYHHLP